MTKQKRIRWSPEEREALLAEMTAKLREPLGAQMSDVDLLRAAQLKLPADRRRKMIGATVSNLRALVKLARNHAKAPVAPPAAAEPPAPSPTPSEPAPQAERALPAGLGGLFEALIDAVADRIILRVLDALPRVSITQESMSDWAARRLNERAAAEALRNYDRPARPGVLIIGLLNAQADTITRMHPELDITTLAADEAVTREPIRRAHTVLMTKFINHSVQEKYRKAPRLHFCNGGVTELDAILQQLTKGAKL